MEIKKTSTTDGMELTLTGRLDVITSKGLQAALIEAVQSSETVVLDFGGVEYLSSAGLRALLNGQKAAQQSGKSIMIKNVMPEVMEVFDITGFSGILTII